MIFPWQETQWHTVHMAREKGRLPQALLLTGEKGLGKSVFASELSQLLLCVAGGEYPCQHCRSCQLFHSGSHPDYYCIQPPVENKTIQIDQIRELIAKVNQTGHQGNCQVVCILSADKMHVGSANALLKTLEEPAGNVFFILVSAEYAKLPSTILSRCQRLRFLAQPQSVCLSWLEERMGHSRHAKQLLCIANGLPLVALKMVETNYLLMRDALLNHLIAVQIKQVNVFEPVNEWLKNVDTGWLETWMSIVLDCLRLKLGVSTDCINHSDKLEQLQSLTKLFSSASLSDYLLSLQRVASILSRSNSVNRQLLIERLLLSWCELGGKC